MASFKLWVGERFPYPTKLEIISGPTRLMGAVELRDRLWELQNIFFSEGPRAAHSEYVKTLKEAVRPGQPEVTMLILRMLGGVKRT